MGRARSEVPSLLLDEHVSLPVCVGLPAGPGPIALEPDRSSCGGGMGAALKGHLEGQPGIVETGGRPKKSADQHRSEAPMFAPGDRVCLVI